MSKKDRIKELEKRVAWLEARLAAVERGDEGVVPWKPSIPPSDGTAQPYNPFPNIWYSNVT